MRIAYRHWKEQWQFQQWETKVFQLQQVQAYGQRMLKEKRKENSEMFQIQQRRAHSQELQRKAINEEIKDSKEIRWWRWKREEQKTGF